MKKALKDPDDLSSLIVEVRGEKVIIDSHLAAIYGIPTKFLNRAVKRNLRRFPPDFIFQSSVEEAAALRFHFGTSKAAGGGRRYLPYAFTEHGAIMAANVLNSPRAVEMSVFVIHAFVKMLNSLSRANTVSRTGIDSNSLAMTHICAYCTNVEFRVLWLHTEVLMSRISIDVTDDEHKKLKAMAAIRGKSIKEYVLERTLRTGDADEAALQELERLLDKRIQAAAGGAVSRRTASKIFAAAARKKKAK